MRNRTPICAAESRAWARLWFKSHAWSNTDTWSKFGSEVWCWSWSWDREKAGSNTWSRSRLKSMRADI